MGTILKQMVIYEKQMENKSLFIDIDLAQQRKYTENICGDSFLSKRYPDEGRVIAVLSDGLGSGIKANILSSITATMLLNFIAARKDSLKSAEIVMNSLPVCQVRKISYATFSSIDCTDDGKAQIVEEGNPKFLWIREGVVMEVDPLILSSKVFENRELSTYEIQLKPEDRVIFCSDGVTQAGLGSDRLRLGWRRSGLAEFVLERLKKDKHISSRQLAKEIVEEAIIKEECPKDDISAVVLYFRRPRELLVFTGPPYYADRDNKYANMFFSFSGEKVICGGTTANIVARELNKEIHGDIKQYYGELPACSHMQGVSLITEGILTLTRALEYLENGGINFPKDSAGKLVDILLNNDCISFMVGAKLNQAHYDPEMPIELEIRKNIVKRLVKILEEDYLKKISLKFI